MADKVAPVNPPTSTENIRNVVLIGPSGAGKTTLVESMLFAAGAIQRAGAVPDGTTVSDYDEVEKRQERSVNLSVAAFDHNGVRINLIDVPGYADFAGEVGARRQRHGAVVAAGSGHGLHHAGQTGSRDVNRQAGAALRTGPVSGTLRPRSSCRAVIPGSEVCHNAHYRLYAGLSSCRCRFRDRPCHRTW